MSKLLINKYYSDLDRILQFGKTKNEGSISIPFLNLLNEYARKYNYHVVHQERCKGTKGKDVQPDGLLKDSFKIVIGLWESKDEKDKIDDEIDIKQEKGYPFFNILFEDSQTAVLIQKGAEVMRVSMKDPDRLHAIITEFISFKSEFHNKFEDALECFKADIPTIVETLRKRIDDAGIINKDYIKVAETFLLLCKAEINPDITEADIREMLIQHILTSDIFNKVFDDPEFHRHNNIARELEKLIDTLFTYSERRNLLVQIEHYYDTISAAASHLTDHHDKQYFLKVLYENFYKVYNPKAADRLGVVYTPNEIVKFMIESTDYLLHKQFNKTLADKNVDILDPATGTGTFITSIIDYIPNQFLKYKYQHEIHANEVAILPYYVANLNMEFTYKQKMGYYEEFKNLCFVDTLDNTDALSYGGMQHDLFGLSTENTARIKNQNSKNISVIIGNPPYNALQKSFYDENQNRKYPIIDNRIKDTYAKESNTQNIQNIYDMYTRFYRWASDRIKGDGILSFITNRSFIDAKSFDGFRKTILKEFDYIYVIDLGGDLRANVTNKKTKGNVFGIMTGIAICFLIKDSKNITHNAKVNYFSIDDNLTKEEKFEFLNANKINSIPFEHIEPDKDCNWINLSNNDFDLLLPIADKQVKLGRIDNALFKLYSLGIATGRDEWVYDFSEVCLEKKMTFFISKYNFSRINKNHNKEIKWDRELLKYDKKNIEIRYEKDNVITSLYRPFIRKKYFFNRYCSQMIYQWNDIFSINDNSNRIIGFITGTAKPFSIFINNSFFDLNCISPAAGGTQCLPLYRYNNKGERIDNITDWGLEQFTTHYNNVIASEAKQSQNKKQIASGKSPRNDEITKEDIFHYTYAVLHNPAYRTKYELNLKREFPRLPFYEDFNKWSAWGKQLMDLHINYEQAVPFDLKENTFTVKAEAKRQKEIFSNEVSEPEEMFTRQIKIKPRLKADKEAGLIEIDDLTFLTGVPAEAWEYKLGNRSALEWILDQYKEKKPTDPTIAEKFNTYRFADYKEHVIDLLKRVCTVSVETMKIIGEMKVINN